MESIETTCYALVSHPYVLDFERDEQEDLSRDVSRTRLTFRFNLVNHNNHGVDASKYSK
jgi:hypothetical protein